MSEKTAFFFCSIAVRSVRAVPTVRGVLAVREMFHEFKYGVLRWNDSIAGIL
ncbi:MAG: hypothetical protein JNL64_10425 [Blastocatellia bacterium]|nr:hypothetical protein [Blastocatellia bacterium]